MGVSIYPPEPVVVAGESVDGSDEPIQIDDSGQVRVSTDETELLEQILDQLRLANFHNEVLSGVPGIGPDNIK